MIKLLDVCRFWGKNPSRTSGVSSILLIKIGQGTIELSFFKFMLTLLISNKLMMWWKIQNTHILFGIYPSFAGGEV